jgi:hypothetical protein
MLFRRRGGKINARRGRSFEGYSAPISRTSAELDAADHLKSPPTPSNRISTTSSTERAVTDHLKG